jgi:signal transduction histidine kinase
MVRRSWSDIALALVVFAGSLGLLAAGNEHDGLGDLDGLDIALTALASLPLVAWRSAPLRVFAFTGLASAALRLVGAPAGPPLGPTVALFGVGAAGGRERRTLAVVLAVFAAHVTASGVARDAFPAAELALGITVWGGAWLAGERTRLRRERMAELEERAAHAKRDAERERRLAAAEERMRIARDLHDSAGHAINVILVHAGLGRLQTERDPAAARAAFETIEEVARETIGEIDQMVRVLREDRGAGDEDGVEPPPGIAALDQLVARHRAAGLDIIPTYRGARRSLPAGVDTAAYPIVQEALTNAARHARAKRVDVTLRMDGNRIRLSVEDDGAGFEPAAKKRNGIGLLGMEERVRELAGHFAVKSAPGAGTRVEVELPAPVASEVNDDSHPDSGRSWNRARRVEAASGEPGGHGGGGGGGGRA